MARPNLPAKSSFREATSADHEATWAARVEAARARGLSAKHDVTAASAADWDAHVRAVKARDRQPS